MNSIKSGMGTNEVGGYILWIKHCKCAFLYIMKPSLWNYENIKFILEHTVRRKAVDSLSAGSETQDEINCAQDLESQSGEGAGLTQESMIFESQLETCDLSVRKHMF